MASQKIQRQAQIIKALAHPARLIIVHALAEGQRSVGELQKIVGRDISTVSKHLTLMREAGWVDGEKRGQHVYYRISCECLQDFLGCIDSIKPETAHCAESACGC